MFSFVGTFLIRSSFCLLWHRLPSVLQGFVLFAQLFLLVFGLLGLGRCSCGGCLGGTRRGFLFRGLGLQHRRYVHWLVLLRGFRCSSCASLFLFLLFPAVGTGSRCTSFFLVIVAIPVRRRRRNRRIDAKLVQNVVEIVQIVLFGLFGGSFFFGLLFRFGGFPGFFEAPLPLGLFLLGFFFLLFLFTFFLLFGFVLGLAIGMLRNCLVGEVHVHLRRWDWFCNLICSNGVVNVIFVVSLVQIVIVVICGISPATHGCWLFFYKNFGWNNQYLFSDRACGSEVYFRVGIGGWTPKICLDFRVVDWMCACFV
mmetsp:Transcript_8404/g.20665  ORF Transcript_8404/g.20665 Transcript_8404/m.20665 type:complete len:310 (-) Transcript_8404:207-1136(-)